MAEDESAGRRSACGYDHRATDTARDGSKYLSFLVFTSSFKDGRGGEIRTHDLLVPNQALYQAKLRPETRGAIVAVIPRNAKGKCICFTSAIFLHLDASLRQALIYKLKALVGRLAP